MPPTAIVLPRQSVAANAIEPQRLRWPVTVHGRASYEPIVVVIRVLARQHSDALSNSAPIERFAVLLPQGAIEEHLPPCIPVGHSATLKPTQVRLQVWNASCEAC